MKKLLTWVTKHFWWRKYYYRAYITEEESWKGRCLICEANSTNDVAPRCNSQAYRDCPCKMNQRLIRKVSDWQPVKPKDYQPPING